MKRIFFLLTALCAVLTASAEQYATVSLTDGSTHSYGIVSVNDITFSNDATLLYLHNTDGLTVTYPVACITSIDFEEYISDVPMPYTTDFDVAFDNTDDTSYTSVTEKVPTKDTDPEYGDFVENYDDDEESKGTVTITYNGTSAAITYNPTSLKNKAVLVMSDTSSDIVIYGMKKVDYVVKGATTDGSLTIYGAKKCKLNLNNVSIKNADGPAINMPKTVMSGTEFGGKTVFVELTGTSTLEDGTYTPDGTKGKATFFSEGQLIFSGKGTLNIKSNSGHGIASDDYIRLRGGSNNPVINITTSNSKDGISVNDYFLMYGGTLTINAADDGISVAKGYADIAGGKLTVNAADEGIVATNEEAAADVDPSITVRGGLLKITTTGDKGHALKAGANISQTGGIVQAQVKGAGSKAFNADGNCSFTGGKTTLLVDGLPIYDEEENDVSSAAGIRSRGTLTLDGTTLAIKATAEGGKGINSTGNILCKSGNVTIVNAKGKYTSNGKTSRARGINADNDVTISGGTLRIRSVDNAISTPATLAISGGNLQAFSSESTSISAATVSHTAGWLVTR